MTLKKSVICFLSFIFLASLQIRPEKDRTILFNGKIFTGKSGKYSEAIVIEDGKIVFVGSNNGAEKFGSGKSFLSRDLNGKVVLPGFHDADMNFFLGAALLNSRMNLYGLNLDAVIHRLRAQRKRNNGVIYGFNFEHLLTREGNWPNKYDLDKVSTDSPVVIYSSDGNNAWINSFTLKQCGIRETTVDPNGGRIVRFEDNDPSGILCGSALDLLKSFSFKNAFQFIKPDKNKIYIALNYLNSLGLTSVTSRGDLDLIKILKEIESAGKLTVRFNLILPSKNIGRYLINKIEFNTDSKYIRLVGLTKKIGGNLYTSDAAMFTPYWKSKRYGYIRSNINEISDMVSLYRKNGILGDFDAEGDRGVNTVLNGIQSSARRYLNRPQRHRISNFVFIIKEDLRRLKDMNVVPVMRPAFLIEKFHFIEKLVGERKAVNAVPAGSLVNSGVTFAFGSGWPGEPPDPLKALLFSIYRTIRGMSGSENGWFLEESLSVKDAILAHTFAPSYSVLNENSVGTIERGKFADLIIIEGDLFSPALDSDSFLSTIKISETLIGGKTVFRSGN